MRRVMGSGANSEGALFRGSVTGRSGTMIDTSKVGDGFPDSATGPPRQPRALSGFPRSPDG